MGKWQVDFNCDVGEGVGNEAQLFPFISSCNIACGGHAGNEKTITDIVKLAITHNIKIGAHPSYPDKVNFGRKVMDISKDHLKKSINNQLSIFKKVTDELGVSVHHIKPHGALYNQIAKDEELAKLFLEIVTESALPKRIYALPNSKVALLAEKCEVEVCYEAFADRNYNDDGSLVSRTLENALIQEPQQVLQHILPMIQNGEVLTVSKKPLKIQPDTICVHGDTPTALKILQYLSQELPKNHIVLSK